MMASYHKGQVLLEAGRGQQRGALAAQEGGNEALDRGRQRATLSTHLEEFFCRPGPLAVTS